MQKYDTTCPFVTRVWKKAENIGKKTSPSSYTVSIGMRKQELLSRTPTKMPHLVVIRDMEEAKLLSEFIIGTRKKEEFYKLFKDKHSKGFDPNKDW